MHPIVVALPAKTYPAFFFPAFPPFDIIRFGKKRPVPSPFQLVVFGIKIKGNTPGMRTELGAAPHQPVIKTAAKIMEAQCPDLFNTVFIKYICEHFDNTVFYFFMAGDFSNCFSGVPGNYHRVRQVHTGKVRISRSHCWSVKRIHGGLCLNRPVIRIGSNRCFFRPPGIFGMTKQQLVFQLIIGFLGALPPESINITGVDTTAFGI